MCDSTLTPNCCANCVNCTRMPLPVGIQTASASEDYYCSRFKKLVTPWFEDCKSHQRQEKAPGGAEGG